jgi:HD-GYP domain-containing protein (c-di-GMP phosphodiesterase class II)
MLPAPDTGDLVISRAVGMDSETAAAIRVPKGSGIAGRVFETGEAVIINGPSDNSVQLSRYDTSFFASVPLVCQPLIGPEVVIGVLNVTQREGDRPFEPRELKYLQLISSIAAAAIDDAVTRRARDEARDTIVGALATLAECRDADTGRHLDRVTHFSLILGEDLRMTSRFSAEIDDPYLYDLKRAMPLHDIGKVAVPDCILLKPGKLSQEEMSQMRRHAEIGGQAISSVIGRAPGVRFLAMAEEIARGHHEWFDGTGYPYGLGGDAIPLCARIAALADVYDALTTRRPYKKAFSHLTAVEIIRNSSGTQFDPEIVESFLRREQDFHRVAAELADEADALAAITAAAAASHAPAPSAPAAPTLRPVMVEA